MDTDTHHAKDHDRLDAAVAAWAAAGRPRWDHRNRDKATIARRLELRLNAHLSVLHRTPPTRGAAFKDWIADHDKAHGRG
jgi:hypothetical protein